MLIRLLRCDAMLKSDLRPTCIPSPLPSPSPHITFWYYVPLDSTLPQGPEIHLQFPRILGGAICGKDSVRSAVTSYAGHEWPDEKSTSSIEHSPVSHADTTTDFVP